MTRSLEAKAKIVASAFSSRFNEETDSKSSEILVQIFNAHDLSGPVALAYTQGHIEFKSDDSRVWIEDTFELLCTQFDFPPEDEEFDRSVIDQNSELDKSPNEMGNQFHAYFLEQQADFTTNLQEKDIPRKLLVENAPHSFPVIEVLEMQDLFSGAPEQNALLSEVVKHWINEKQWNYLTALGYLLLLRDDSDFAINLLEVSANLGDPWALFHLEGNSRSLTNSRREAYLLRSFEQGHGMAAFRLACLSIEKNDTVAANEWLIKGCLQGSSDSTKALSNMVSSEDEKLMLSAIAAEQAGTDFETNREEPNDEKSDTDTFDNKVRLVASAFYNRFDEDVDTEMLTRIFESHDLSGAIALALSGGDIELKSDTPKIWIEETFAILASVFDLPDDETHSEPVLLTEAEVFVDYQDKKLNIDDITLSDQITTQHHIEKNRTLTEFESQMLSDILREIDANYFTKSNLAFYSLSDEDLKTYLEFVYYVQCHIYFEYEHSLDYELLESIKLSLQLGEQFNDKIFRDLRKSLPGFDFTALNPSLDTQLLQISSRYVELVQFHFGRVLYRGISLGMLYWLLTKGVTTLHLNTRLLSADQIEYLENSGSGLVDLMFEIKESLPDHVFTSNIEELVRQVPDFNPIQIEALLEVTTEISPFGTPYWEPLHKAMNSRLSNEDWEGLVLHALAGSLEDANPFRIKEILDSADLDWRKFLEPNLSQSPTYVPYLYMLSWHEIIHTGNAQSTQSLLAAQEEHFADWTVVGAFLRIFNGDLEVDLGSLIKSPEFVDLGKRNNLFTYLEDLFRSFHDIGMKLVENSRPSRRADLIALFLFELLAFLKEEVEPISSEKFRLRPDVLEKFQEFRQIIANETEVFSEYQNKQLNINDIELRDQITTRHYGEMKAGGAVINLVEIGEVEIELNLGFDCYAQISTIHTSPENQEVVGIVVLTYGPWTMPGGWGSRYVTYVNELAYGDIFPSNFLLEGCEKIHFISDFIENGTPNIYAIERYLGITSYSEIGDIESTSELEFVIPMSGDYVVGNLIYGDPVSPEELQALDEGNWNQWPFIVIRKDIYDRMSAAT